MTPRSRDFAGAIELSGKPGQAQVFSIDHDRRIDGLSLHGSLGHKIVDVWLRNVAFETFSYSSFVFPRFAKAYAAIASGALVKVIVTFDA